MEEKIDFGKITVPTSWDEISLRQFQEIEKYYKENKDFDVRDIIHILTNKTRDEINELPVEFLEIILQKLSFMNEQPKVEKPTNKIELNGQIYQVNIMNKLKAGEYIAVDSVVKSDASNFAAILAVVCRKDGELFDSKYENEVLEERMKMFENAPITKILPIVNFFLQCYTMSNGLSLLYSKVEEGISLIANSIETSANLGVCKKFYMKWQMKKLQKSLKSIKNI